MMFQRIRESLLAHLQRGSLRRRLAYSLAIVRLILVPVIFLAIYYLFVMGRIVDRIVNEDAPAATLAQQGSIDMLVARRAERTFLLFHDSASVHTVNESLTNVENTLNKIQALQPHEQGEVRQAFSAAADYESRFRTFVSTAADSKSNSIRQIQSVVDDYEKSLDTLIRHERNADRTRLIDELRARASSFDDQITKSIQAADPALSKVTTDLQISSEKVLQTLSALEEQNWNAVQADHLQARLLLRRAEWTLSIVSGLTFLLSLWISFVLPKQIVQPLVRLQQSVDRAADDDIEANLNIRAEGELGQLAESIRRLIAHLRTGHPASKE
jgi:nitrogen fixation/metabolism regulation signal transduction histidine kinase